MLHQGLALAIAAFTFLQLLRGKWPRHVLTLAAGGLMVAVVLLGVMGSLDAVMEAQMCIRDSSCSFSFLLFISFQTFRTPAAAAAAAGRRSWR